MRTPKIDILVMLKHEWADEQVVARELERIEPMLIEAGHLDALSTAHELLDLNHFKTFSGADAVADYIRLREKPAFVFLFNKN